LTVLEALTAGVPVLVNAWCAPTREHCARSGGGLWFADYAEFEAALELITGGGRTRAVMAQLGQRYAVHQYGWPVVLDRYCSFVERFAGR
jgi:glycosyltransferase involved in cell wall biosynthesis